MFNLFSFDFCPGGPVVVTVGFFVMSINAINVMDMVCIK